MRHYFALPLPASHTANKFAVENSMNQTLNRPALANVAILPGKNLTALRLLSLIPMPAAGMLTNTHHFLPNNCPAITMANSVPGFHPAIDYSTN